MDSVKVRIFYVILCLLQISICTQGRKYDLFDSTHLHDIMKSRALPQENFTKNISVASSSLVEIKVYYETLCPGSIQLFRNQLKPVAEKLPEYVKIHLIPFGFAEIKWHNSRPQFRCQHGAMECFGNKLHACVGDALRGSAQAQAQAVLYAACLMDAAGYRPGWTEHGRAFQQCNINMKLSNEKRSRIFTCAGGRRGSKLLVSHGEETRRLDPPYLPYVLVNDNPSEAYLLSTVCSELQPKPEACWQYLGVYNRE